MGRFKVPETMDYKRMSASLVIPRNHNFFEVVERHSSHHLLLHAAFEVLFIGENGQPCQARSLGGTIRSSTKICADRLEAK